MDLKLQYCVAQFHQQKKHFSSALLCAEHVRGQIKNQVLLYRCRQLSTNNREHVIYFSGRSPAVNKWVNSIILSNVIKASAVAFEVTNKFEYISLALPKKKKKITDLTMTKAH